jgi:hypothetical protein
VSASQPDIERSETVEELLDERNRLWAELQRRRSMDEEAAYWRKRAEDIEESRWWRAGRPLRLAKRLKADPVGTLETLAHDLRLRRRGR